MARHHIIPTLIALCLSTALAAPVTAQDEVAPIMTEVQPNPPGPDQGNEWVEFTNPSPVPLSLDGLYLTDHDPCFAPNQGFVDDYHWPLTGTVPAGGHLVVFLPESCVNLANTGDELHLVTEDGQVLQSVVYGPDGPLPVPSEDGTLAACHVAANLHGAWSTAQASPGATNPAC